MPNGLFWWSLTVTFKCGSGISPSKFAVVGIPTWLYFIIKACSCVALLGQLAVKSQDVIPGKVVVHSGASGYAFGYHAESVKGAPNERASECKAHRRLSSVAGGAHFIRPGKESDCRRAGHIG